MLDTYFALDTVLNNIARPYNYSFAVSIPNNNKNLLEQIKHTILVNRFSIPENTMQTIDVIQDGKKYQTPIQINFPRILSCTAYMEEHSLFDSFYGDLMVWFASFDKTLLGNLYTKGGMVSKLLGDLLNGFNDKDDSNMLLGSIVVKQINYSGSVERIWTFNDVFPIKIGQISFDASQKSGIITFDIDFYYSTYVCTEDVGIF